MSDNPIGDSAQDFGATKQFIGSVGTTSTAVPAVAGDFIATALIRCPQQTPNTRILFYSFDNVVFTKLSPGEFIIWPTKGNLTQIFIKGNVASVDYEVILNREPT